MRADDFQAALRALPAATLEQLVPATAMILAPHPDDESLGCGGLIAALCAAGRPPLVVIATDGAASHDSASYPPERLRHVRAQEAKDAVAALGLAPERVVFLGLPDAACPARPPHTDGPVRALCDLAAQHGCTTLLASWGVDPHCDHEAVWAMAQAVARVTGMALLAYPVWSWVIPAETELDLPPPHGWRFDIGDRGRAKRTAIAAHRSQYGGLITDDPAGFTLPHALIEACTAPFEVFVAP